MNEVIRAAADLRDVLDTHHWRYAFIGGLAVLRWGEPRETVDVDVTLLTGFVDEEAYVTALLARFEPRIDDAAAFAGERSVADFAALSTSCLTSGDFPLRMAGPVVQKP